jgi:hypothetical protein
MGKILLWDVMPCSLVEVSRATGQQSVNNRCETMRSNKQVQRFNFTEGLHR